MNYQYVVIPRSCPTPQSLEMYHLIYDSWLELWRGIFSEGDRQFEPSTDDFLRQDFVLGIFDQGNLVGFHLYSFFDLQKKMSSRHSYFKGVDPESFTKLREEGLNTVMTMEYLSVMPKYRKKYSSIPWGEVIIALGQEFMKTTEGDVAFGTARKDLKVDSFGLRLGFTHLQLPIEKYQYTCAVMTCPKGDAKAHPEIETARLISELWSNRIDYRNDLRNIKKTA